MIRIPRRGRARAYLSAAPRSRGAVDSLRICISEVKDLPSPNQKPKTKNPRTTRERTVASGPSSPGAPGRFLGRALSSRLVVQENTFRTGRVGRGIRRGVGSFSHAYLFSPPTRNHLVVLGPVGRYFRYFLALGARARDTPRARRCPPASPRAVPAAPPPRSPPRLLPRCPRRRRARSARPRRASSPSRSRGSFFSRPRRTPRAAPRAVRSPRATTPSRRPWRPLLPSPPP